MRDMHQLLGVAWEISRFLAARMLDTRMHGEKEW